jgi:ketosteroid isomerase-like protein
VSTTLAEAAASFYAALNHVLAGDVGPMHEVWSHEPDITYMSPFGELLEGWEPIRASWQAQAEAGLGGEVHAEDLRVLERGEVEVDGRPTRVDIRATSLYRREGGHWRMIGHHTDPLA